MIFDTYARDAARLFGWVYFLKLRSSTDDFGGVLMLYTGREVSKSPPPPFARVLSRGALQSHPLPLLLI